MIAVVPRDTNPRLPLGFIDTLRADLAERCIQRGFDWLDTHRSALEHLGPDDPQAAAITGYTAQWVDVGYRSPELLKKLLARFPERGRARLTVEEFAHVQIAEGVVALSSEDLDRAMAMFNVVLALAPNLDDQELVVAAHFGRARCHRRKGEYGTAYQETISARDLADSLRLHGMAAVIRTLEGWLVFR
jgi:tetratricopeptide (TPR) repeat protein